MKLQPLTIYLAGPMTGHEGYNYHAFNSVAERLRSSGRTVLNPAENHGGRTDLSYAEYLREAIGQVLQADELWVLPEWETSRGARLEVNIARVLDLPVKEVATGKEIPTGVVGDPRFHALLQTIGQLHDKKQRDYGTAGDPFANVRASQSWGVKPWVGALLRLTDKVTRLQAFAQKGELANESAEDSMMDISVYALIAYILYKEESENGARKESTGSPTTGAAGSSGNLPDVQTWSPEEWAVLVRDQSRKRQSGTILSHGPASMSDVPASTTS